MYSHRNEFLQDFGSYAENDPSRVFTCIRASANTGGNTHTGTKIAGAPELRVLTVPKTCVFETHGF